MPLNIGLLLMLIGLYQLFRNKYAKAKVYLLVSFVWLALIHFIPFTEILINPLEMQYSAYKGIPTAKYVLVLGNGHSSNDNIPIPAQTSKISLMRLSEALRLKVLNPKMKIITSGYGGGDRRSQAQMQKEVAMVLGVKEEDIILCGTSKDTQEEAINVKKMIGEEPFILVTSAAHMPRAMALFKKQGLAPIPAPTDFLASGEKNPLHYFSADALSMSTSAFHEYIGILYARLRGII